ncbi:transporter [Fulvivirga sp. M361]|uniref:transporter n=1 Tax=Fulvivirga sp. M361 TaxID=2594266 RepID=UPI00117BB447|nr:transporter [Fulvivirga sp. M361]TRX49342.1 transporter [Fulvivirga sp. M361]
MKKPLFAALSFLLFHSLSAQYSEVIITSRPGQAVVPFTTGQKVFQVQTGFNYTDSEDDSSNQSINSLGYAADFRYGILENFEIRSGFQTRRDDLTFETGATDQFGGLSSLSAGIRYNIISGEGFKPSFGFQTDVSLPWVDEAYEMEEIAPRLMLIHSQQLTDFLGLTTNWSVSWNGNDNHPKGGYVINLAFPISGKWSGFIENYGEVADSDFDTRWDTGLAFLVNNNFQLDLSAGFGDNEELTDWFVDAGISWRTRF